ncbi:SdpI family protein [Microtetraspora niveoalba]|uniref:SdpI family protein n=1 Tax=Microtetraspora niveoalba TaxID=46175 RepID=UPI0008308C70|nr:SdpI family protein [Microtetraspora niveoalba]
MSKDAATEDRLDIRPGLIATAAALLLAGGISLWGWTALPDDARIPMHWGPSGEVDRYGGKTEALITLPLIVLGLGLLLAVAPRLMPRRQNAARSRHVYFAAWVGTLVLLTVTHAVSVFNAAGGDLPVVRIIMALIALLFVVLGNYLPKSRSNWIAGVRTPWTLESDVAWRRANRLAGILFAVVGLALLVGAFILPIPALVVLTLTGTAVCAIGPTVYSWWIWRADPGR